MRAFICFPVSEEIKTNLDRLIEDARGFEERLSWTKSGNYHLTIKFLGEVTSGPRLQNIKRVLAECASDTKPFDVNFHKIGAFPTMKHPSVFWVGSEEQNRALIDCAAKVDHALVECGFEKEKRIFRPHLTLARTRHAAPKTATFFSSFKLPSMALMCRELLLMKSVLRPQGAHYTIIEKFNLEQGLS